MTPRRITLTPPGWVAPMPGFSWVVVIEHEHHREVSIAGQVALDGADLVGAGDAEAQAACCYARIAEALTVAGGTIADVVETRTYLLDMADLAAVARVRQRVLADPPPTSTALQVSGFAVPGALVEIEARAVILGS